MKRLDSAHIQYLAHGQSLLHLSVETPDRVPPWDDIVLTAASDSQARLYEYCLQAARDRGALGPRTRARVVPDPGGRRIGSGGATLHALRALAADGGPAMAGRRVLLVHSGGDSRRVPWANIFGKVFLPLPLLANPDHPLPTLFDHLLALAAPLAYGLAGGGLATLAGDVLPLFDAARVTLPENGGVVVTTPVPLDLAGKHGVIVAGADNRVLRLLQKAGPQELSDAGALVEGGSALLDTGLWIFTGASWRALTDLAARQPGPLDGLLASGRECSLYEDLAAAFVPGNRARALADPALGPAIAALSGPLFAHRADEMAFLHFGTTAEILAHFARPWFGELLPRLASEEGPLASPAAHLYESRLAAGARVGWGSLIVGGRLADGVSIGHRCVVVGLDEGGEALRLPDNHCLWQVPLRAAAGASPAVAYVCCGVDDQPGAAFERATFCNQDFSRWIADHGLTPEDLWPAGAPRTLWHARLFPALSAPASLQLTAWTIGDGRGPAAGRQRAAWRAARRLSLADLHAEADVEAWQRRREELRADLLLRALNDSVAGALDRDLFALVGQLRGEGLRARAVSLADRYLADDALAVRPVSASRALQMRADLLAAGGQPDEAAAAAARAFAAVQDEVARAVRFHAPDTALRLEPGLRRAVRLPVRFDISGGWSDTPPYCLERPALVLNFALLLNGALPVVAEVESLAEPVWEIEASDLGLRTRVTHAGAAAAPTELDDPFTLVKTALRITGYAANGAMQGVRVRTSAAVPKGSGLGTSSILGAALIRALLQLAGRPDDTRTVSDLVLVLEQQMRTGGGWQDQVGGLVPGVKCIRSRPVRPLAMDIESVPLLPAVARDLERRLVIVFTGQQRLARNILQIVVERYLRRDARTLAAIRTLVELADDGRAALAMGELDELGRVLGDAWRVLQALTPECSNPRVDRLFRAVEDLTLGGKLAGAGGGGFLGLMARDPEAAARIRTTLEALDPAVRAYDWRLWTGEGSDSGA